MDHFLVNDPFLRQLSPHTVGDLEFRLRQWGLSQTGFTETVDRWFGNFEAEDKQLALKVLFHLDYFSPSRFASRIQQLRQEVFRQLHDQGLQYSAVVVAIPGGGGDSAQRHAYDIGKEWKIPNEHIRSVGDLMELDLSNAALILFNDTHGSGNQFFREIWPLIKRLPTKPAATFVLAVAMASAALKRFQDELPEVRVVPSVATLNAHTAFSAKEVERLAELGKRVYPKHPLGYGGTALLTAYYFQCPNNTLPIIWADGRNNTVNDNAYPWFPLFPYRPKASSAEDTTATRLKKRALDALTIRSTRRLNIELVDTLPDSVDSVSQVTSKLERLFLHYLDQYYLDVKSAGVMLAPVLRECQLATRLALLAADEILISASWYVESPLCRKVIDELRPLFDQGRIWMLGEASNLPEYRERKLRQFPTKSGRHSAYHNIDLALAPPFLSRHTNATSYIVKRWEDLLRTNTPRQFAEMDPTKKAKEFEKRWGLIPERLGAAAFIVDHVRPLLFDGPVTQVVTNKLYAVLNKAFFESFTREHTAGIITDLVYLRSPIPIASHGVDLPYQKLCDELRHRGLLKDIMSLPPTQLLNIRDDPRWRAGLQSVLLNWQPLLAMQSSKMIESLSGL